MTSERALVKRIGRELDKIDRCWWMKVHGGGFQRSGVPDIIGVIDGRFFAIEAKTVDGVLSKLQEVTLEDIRRCGGLTTVARCLADIGKITGGD